MKGYKSFFLKTFLAYFSIMICFNINIDVAAKHDDENQHRAMEYGLIQAMNEMLGMDNVILMDKLKFAKEHGEMVEKLDMDNIFEQFYQHIGVESEEERTLRGPNQFQIIIKTLEKKPMTMWVDNKMTVKRVKLEIRKRKRGPPIYQQRLMFRGKPLKDLQTMHECGITEDAGVAPTIHLLLRLRGGGFAHYYMNPEFFDPQFNRDFRGESEFSYYDEEYYRGGRSYHHPWGSMRYAIKVLDKYPDNNWLNKPLKHSSSNGDLKYQYMEKEIQPISDEPQQEGWPVAYHGTSDENAIAIVKEGFRLDKGKTFYYGKGIYATPYPKNALKYAKEYEYKGKKYKLILQTRVEPSKLELVLQDADFGRYSEYWLLPDSDAIRPYGIWVYEVNEKEEEDDNEWFIHNLDL